jgi:hypothetical protein
MVQLERELNVDCSPPHGLLYKRSSNQGQSVKETVGCTQTATGETMTVCHIYLPMIP